MKTLIALALIVTANAQAAPLIKAERMPGYEMNPQHREFVLDTSGALTMTVETYREKKKEVINLGQLNPETVAKIAAQVNELGDDSELVDPRKGEPMCTDAPSYSVSVFKGEKEIVIQQRANCHKAEVQHYLVKDLAGFANLFLNL